MLSIFLLFGLFLPVSHAGPPPGGRVIQVPFFMYCHPSVAMMLDAVMRSFGQHISATFKPHDDLTIYVMENKEEKTISVVGERENDTCLILSGKDAEYFKRPVMMPPRDTESGDVEA